MEQDLTIDPETGFRRSDGRNKDAKQNVNYVRHTDPADTTRDYSRPHTIPADEFTATTGKNHAEACTEYEAAEQDRQRKREDVARAAR